MKTLLILRHAKSDWSTPGQPDHQRPLNERGKRDAPQVGELLTQLGLVPQRMISSTAKRARKTAEKVANASGFPGEVELTDDFYMAHPRHYLQVLQSLPDEVDSVMVVGHNPGLEELIQVLTGVCEAMPTAALAKVVFDFASWTELSSASAGRLEHIWRPKEVFH